MAKKDKTQEETEEVTLAQRQEENDKNFELLTNKNSEYMVKLNRRLDEKGFDKERKIEIFNDMLPNIIEQQKNHVTARKLYGTVTERANQIMANPNMGKEQVYVRSETWKLYLDGALLLGGMFALISGISYLFGNEMSGMGLFTIILNFLLGGLAMLVITRYAPVPGQKGGFLKYIIATTLTMGAWIVLMSLGTVIIPPQLNPFIPGSVTLVIGVAALILKWYLKRRLNIQGTLV